MNNSVNGKDYPSGKGEMSNQLKVETASDVSPR